MNLKHLLCTFLFSLTFTCLIAQPKVLFKIENKFAVGGDGGWDYLTSCDSLSRLYISHGNQVQVMDTKTGQIIASVPDTKGVHGIAIALKLNKGFISCGRDSAVVIFDLETNAVIEKVATTGGNPDAILYDPFTQRIFSFNGRGHNSTVIDAVTNKVIETIPLDGKPEFAVSNYKGQIFVNLEDKNQVCMIDAAAMKVKQSWPLAPGQEPSGLAIDREHERLFSVCDNNMMIVLDAQSGKVIQNLPIGERVDGVAFDPVKKYIYTSNGDGTMNAIFENTPDMYVNLDIIQTQKGARTIALDQITHHIYLPCAEYEALPDSEKSNPKARAKIKPGSFSILDIKPVK